MADGAAGILLDTSAIVAHLRGKIDIFALVTKDEPLFVPLVALGELSEATLSAVPQMGVVPSREREQ